MVLLLQQLFAAYRYAKEDLADPRTSEWFLVKSPIPVLFLCITYLLLVTEWLPEFMQNRKAIPLRKTLILYNLVQIGLSAYIVIKGFPVVTKLNILCAPVDYAASPDVMIIPYFGWLYFMIKITDLLDTVFFILRKKFKQASFLHVYHHSGTLIMGWIGVKYLPGGEVTFLGYINSFVHVIMYTYYLYCVWKPENRNSINSWKKYVTQLQLIQFVVLLCLYFPKIFTDCSFPKMVLLLLSIQNIAMLFMFSDFYYKAYIKGKKATKVTI